MALENGDVMKSDDAADSPTSVLEDEVYLFIFCSVVNTIVFLSSAIMQTVMLLAIRIIDFHNDVTLFVKGGGFCSLLSFKGLL